MTTSNTPLETLGTRLCPWLFPALERLQAARRAERLGHAWLIAGPPGVGKLNLAFVAARQLLHGNPAEPAPLGPKEAVEALASRYEPADHHADLHWLHPEEGKSTISVEQIRATIDALSLTSHGGNAKVVVIEPADAMTLAAANSLLKTLEQPSGDAYLFLLSAQPDRLPPTIRSRCQRLDLKRPTADALAAWLGIKDISGLADLCQMAGGSPLRAASLLNSDRPNANRDLRADVAAVSGDRADPIAVAKAWVDGDLEITLVWLLSEINSELRWRLGAGVSNAVTVRSDATGHNAWRGLTFETLFGQYERAQRLLNQLGSGVNLELAVQALLFGFQANRGQS
jgi:DNA polymerase-3 subunit delta'